MYKKRITPKTKYIFIIFVVVFFCFYFTEKNESSKNSSKYTLEEDGICILYNPEYATKKNG